MTFKKDYMRKLAKATPNAWIKAFEDVIPVYVGSFALEKTTFLRATKERKQAKVMSKYTSTEHEGYSLRLLYTEHSGKITFKLLKEGQTLPEAIALENTEHLIQLVQTFEQNNNQ